MGDGEFHKKVIVFAAHPDDAELMMGGTIIKMIDAGWDLILVDLTNGEPTPYGSIEIRARETEKANQILGVTKRICLGLPNRYLHRSLRYRKKIAEVIRAHRPEIVFGPCGKDYHPDHSAAWQLISDARFEAKLHKTDLQGEPYWVAKCIKYYSPNKMNSAVPSFIVDITDVWDRKIEAVMAYQSQLHAQTQDGQPVLIDHLEAMGRFYGRSIGKKYGEPFLTCEPVGIRHINQFFGGLL